MAGNDLIDAYLGELAGRLPADAVDELADGLAETYRHHRDRGLDAAAAARAATVEFGAPDLVVTAFARSAPGRRTAVGLFRTAPILAAGWAATLVSGRAWDWPIPVPVAVAYGVTMTITIAVLGAVAVNRTSYRRTRLAAAGGASLIVLDAAMLAAVALAAPGLVWPMALAVPASLARIGLTIRAMPRILSS